MKKIIFTLKNFWMLTVSSKSIHINPGQSKNDVLSIMDTPDNRQFYKNQEIQYCSTGAFVD